MPTFISLIPCLRNIAWEFPGALGSIPGQGIKIPQDMWQKKKKLKIIINKRSWWLKKKGKRKETLLKDIFRFPTSKFVKFNSIKLCPPVLVPIHLTHKMKETTA